VCLQLSGQNCVLGVMMAKVILSVNVGSSSIKVTAFNIDGTASDANDPAQIAACSIGGLDTPPSKLQYTRKDHRIKDQELQDVQDPAGAFQYIWKHLVGDEGLPEISGHGNIAVVCHRVVHGGDFPEAQIINQETFHVLERLSDLAPLHNVPALELIREIHSQLPPTTKNIAFFDTTFHSTISSARRTYPINPKVAKHNQLRKYGFHGLSYAFLTRQVADFLRQPIDQTNIIALHLGSGASACAIRKGASFDTSMGLTPLAGLPGATRSGSVDPSLVFHYTHGAGALSQSSTEKMHITQAEEILNKQSGWKALTGTTDFGTVSTRAAEGEEMCRLAFDIFIDRIVGFVANYFVKLDGKVDALVFAGGIGEKGAQLREEVVRRCACLGFKIDKDENNKGLEDKPVVEVGSPGQHPKVLVVETDEQLQMARECFKRIQAREL
jgi:acetate kinase